MGGVSPFTYDTGEMLCIRRTNSSLRAISSGEAPSGPILVIIAFASSVVRSKVEKSAGPAFECANISCGCGYIVGAIESVAVKDGGIIAKTVGDKPALGICGSGLIDAVAAFVKAGYIDSDGNCSSSLRLSANGGTVYINQDDIRALQLAKSAVASAIELLLNKTNTTPEEIDKVYLAGGFGNGININSATEIGIIPKKLAQKAVYAGNTALNGASQLLFNKNLGAEVKKTISTAKHINLGGTEEFNQAFIKNMAF